VDTIARFDAVEKCGVRAEGNAVGASAATLRELAELVAAGDLEVPIAATYPPPEAGPGRLLAPGNRTHPMQDRPDPLTARCRSPR
jgi:hypothetical protein